ncbi:hypothetical protein PtB15_12B112 [Puccinia triticina]|nr:hypothetical protein PtB15_12B112 [Puccinia triticina]
MSATRPTTAEHGPYGALDPDRPHAPKGVSDWGCEEFKMKWYKDADIEVFRQALAHETQDADLSGQPDLPAQPDRSGPSNRYNQLLPSPTQRVPPRRRSSTPCSCKRTRTFRPRKDVVREGWAYHLFRLPLLIVIGLASLCELLVYVSVRQIVTLFEVVVSYRGLEGRLRRKLAAAATYEEWKQTALELDELLGFEPWKKHSSNAYYDSSSVRKVLVSLEQSRLNDNAEGVKDVLEVCLRANFAGIESLRLYSQTHLGTKNLIENYVEEVEKSIIYLRDTPLITAHEKTVFFRRTAKNLGTSALCLSGGGTFGYYHLGVIKALVDARLLPTVITGASAGSLVAALLCTRTDEELGRILVPELADMITGAEEPIQVWLPRMIRTGARFDTVIWAKKSCFFTMGSMTFLEAYERTGRILNVSVIPHDLHSPTTLLNYITAPNCVIFSAILASAAVPLVMNPVVLLEKKKDGRVRPWRLQGKHKDGSLRVDVPLESLHIYFNTSFSIVSQVNPHVHLFFFQPRGAPGQPVVHRKGQGWRGGFLLSALEQYMKIELVKNLRVIRDLELLPAEFGGQTFTAVFLQRFEGTVTIWPHSRLKDLVTILEDPSRAELSRMIDVGRRATWPKMRMIENRLRIERQVFEGRTRTKQSREPLFDEDEDDDEDQKDYATKLDEILHSNQLRHHQQPTSTHEDQSTHPSIILPDTKTNGQDHPVLESFIELTESDEGSVKPSIIPSNHLPQASNQSPVSPPVVVPPNDPSPSSSPSTSISQRIGFNRRSSSITPSHSITGSNTSSNLWFTNKLRPQNSHFSRLRSLHPSSTANNSPASLQLPNHRCVSSSTLASYHSYDDRCSPRFRHQSEQPYSPSPSIVDRNPSTYSNGLQSPSIIIEPDAQEVSASGIFRWASLRRITQKIYSRPRRLLPSTAVSPANSPSNTLLGLPTAIATSGVIVVGTAKGWAMVFDYASNLKCVLGSDAVVRDAGAVSALAISHDHTFVAVGHIMGHIYLYDLAKPSPPTRTVLPTSLRLVQEGRSEGHLLGNRIIHIDFIGLRHTAIVSADETGLAFYHALGQVLGLASTDVIRILGKYPDQGTIAPQNGLGNQIIDTPTGAGHSRQFSDFSVNSASIGAPKSRKSTKIFGALPLPLGPTPHPTDHHGLVALLTSSKLIIVALKPTPRTCWRCMRTGSDPNQTGLIGSLSWFPSSTVKEASGPKKTRPSDPAGPPPTQSAQLRNEGGVGMDPLLAFSWGKTVRFVTVISDHSASRPPDNLAKDSFLKGFTRRLEGNFPSLRFVEGKKWSCSSNVLAIQWLSWRIICVLTSTHFEVIDTQIWQRTGLEPIDLRGVVRLNIFKETALNQSHANPLATPPNFSASEIDSDLSVGGSVAGSFKAYKGKIFLLTTDDLRLGMVVSWAEQILELVEVGALTEAIDLTTSYWIGRADLETIGLPSEDSARKAIVKPKVIEIMRASLEYVFSDRRMEDDTHFDLDGRGVDRTELFEGLVRSCAKACIAIGEMDFIFEEMFEQYQEHGIQTIFFLQLEPFILSSDISTLPTAVTQGLIGLHEDRKQFELIDQIIRRVDPACLDINQALAICSREMLHDALVYIYTEAMNDFVGPIVEFLHLIKSIHAGRQRIQQYCEDSNIFNPSDFGPDHPLKAEDRIEGLVPIAYKIFPYLSTILSGLSYPNKIPYENSRASRAKSDVYQFLFSGKSMHWPQPDGKLILTTEEGQQEPTYPYLRMLLSLDSEAMLDTLDIAFEDSWLHDYPERECEKRIDRQLIITLLLEVTSGDPEFSAGDRTFVYIFIARNLPKYSQFLSLPNSTLHSILIGLSSDDDRSTTEDRQLAVEFLLSVYTPPDVETGAGDLLERFKEAGFWKILTSVYTQREMWVDVVYSQLKNLEDLDLAIFDQLSNTLRKIKSSKTAATTDKDERVEVKVVQVLLNSINQLIEINVPQTVCLIHKFSPQTHLEVVESIGDMFNQFRYLRTLLEPTELDPNDAFQAEAVFKKPLAIKPDLYAAIRIRYVGLLGKLDPNHVLDYLKSEQPFLADHTSDIVRICREEQIYDALVWQLDQAGRTRATFEELDIILKSQASCIAKWVATNDEDGDDPSGSQSKTLESCVSQLTRCAHTAAEICVERTRNPQDGLSGEDCWFYLLSTTVQCTQSCAPLLPPRLPSQHRASGELVDQASPVDPQKDAALNAIASFQGLLPSIVSLLISRTTSSHRISFSNLVRRLIECSSTNLSTVESKSGSIPSNEFRSIILMIMDTYRFEGNVLEVTGRLIDEDLFEHVDRLAKAKQKGIRPVNLSCFKCQKPILVSAHHRPSRARKSSSRSRARPLPSRHPPSTAIPITPTIWANSISAKTRAWATRS